MSKTTYPEHVKSETQREAFDKLKELLKPGQTVYTNVNTVSRSGMSRNISAYIVHEGKVLDISWIINRLNGKAIPEQGGVKMGGCGMDMGFALVYGLSRTLWHEGYRCNGEHHRDGGYALNQEWL